MTVRGAVFACATLVVILVLASPTWDFLRGKYGDWREARLAEQERRDAVRNRAQNERPARLLPWRPGDRTLFPREKFAIRYVDDDGFVIDTASGTVTIDRIAAPDTMIALRLQGAQLDSLYEQALRDRLFEMNQPRALMNRWPTAPGGTLTVVAGRPPSRLRWDPWSLSAPWSDDHKRLNAFVLNLWRMVSSTPEYRARPRPTGAYID